MRNQKFGFFAKFGFKVVCVPRLKNQQPESKYQSGITLRKEVGLFSVPHFVYHYHYLLQIASKNENSAKRCSPPLKDLYQVQETLKKLREFSTVLVDRVVFGSTEHFCNFAKVSYFKGLVSSSFNGQKEFLHIVASILKS